MFDIFFVSFFLWQRILKWIPYNFGLRFKAWGLFRFQSNGEKKIESKKIDEIILIGQPLDKVKKMVKKTNSIEKEKKKDIDKPQSNPNEE